MNTIPRTLLETWARLTDEDMGEHKPMHRRFCTEADDDKDLDIHLVSGWYNPEGKRAYLHIFKEDDKLVYDLDVPDWKNFKTSVQFVAAAVASKVNFRDSKELKKVPFEKPDENDWEDASYWISGGNFVWKYKTEKDFEGNWEKDKAKIVKLVKETFRPKLNKCKTMYDVVEVLDEENFKVVLKDKFPKLFDGTDLYEAHCESKRVNEGWTGPDGDRAYSEMSEAFSLMDQQQILDMLWSWLSSDQLEKIHEWMIEEEYIVRPEEDEDEEEEEEDEEEY